MQEKSPGFRRLGTKEAMAGRAAPTTRRRTRTPSPSSAPVFPALTIASAWRFATSSKARRMEESRLRMAPAGGSSMRTTPRALQREMRGIPDGKTPESSETDSEFGVWGEEPAEGRIFWSSEICPTRMISACGLLLTNRRAAATAGAGPASPLIASRATRILFVVFSAGVLVGALNNFAVAIESAAAGEVVATMGIAGRGVDGQGGRGRSEVGAAHPPSGGGLLILLDGHAWIPFCGGLGGY